MVLAIVACGPETASPSPDGPAIRAPEVEAPVVLDDALMEAIEIREQYGLRADVAWVRTVAEHPDAITHETWGIPLMLDELADVMSRRWPNSLIVQLRQYGLGFPGEFATAYINQKASGAVVEFTTNLERHRAALATLPLDGPVEVRKAEWSLRELGGFLAQVKAEVGWIEGLGGRHVWPDVMELENKVVVRYEGPAGIEQRILDHFGDPRWLKLEWYGPAH